MLYAATRSTCTYATAKSPGCEGVGVQPDVPVDGADALVRGYAIALQKSTNPFAGIAARRADTLADVSLAFRL